MGYRTRTFGPKLELMDFYFWTRIFGIGFLDLDLDYWIWTFGFRFLDLDIWNWAFGLEVLNSDYWT